MQQTIRRNLASAIATLTQAGRAFRHVSGFTGLAGLVAAAVLLLVPMRAQSADSVRLERSEAWAPQPLAAPKTAQQPDGTVAIAGNATRTCTGGWQFVYAGVRGGQTYRLRARVGHRDVANPRDSLLALAYWGKWEPTQNKTRTVPYDYLSPQLVSPSAINFETTVTAPDGATALTIRYLFRWSEQGTSNWSAPQIELATAQERKPVKICVVSNPKTAGSPVKVRPLAAGLGLSGDVEQSVNLWASLILEACQRQPQLILIPETVIGGQNPLEGAITVPGPATQPFEKIARDHHVYLMLGVYERDRDAVYNSTVLIDPQGKVAGVYRKVHLATDEGWSGISPGNGFPVFDSEIGRIGSMICMDSMLSEPARMLALNGADFICLPIMGDLRADRLTPGPPMFNEERWKAIMRTRALDNQVCLIVARNAGQGSCIINRRGDIVAWNEGDRNIIEATLPPDSVRYWDGGDVRETTFLLRRPRLYYPYADEAVLGPLAPKPVRSQTSDSRSQP
ncbi:MAG: carbon-nitrogen hydrolase family protein [Opitutaceae bacterium]|nr:carbon-nitrogen hydrolase family protein [Opitutaceae bacterium]